MKKIILCLATVILFAACGGSDINSSSMVDSLAIKTADSAVQMKDTLHKMIDSAKVDIKVVIDDSSQKKK